MNEKGMALANKYCQGSGLEIGAGSHNAFYLPDCLNLGPCDGVSFLYPLDLKDFNLYANEQANYETPPARIDALGDFMDIPYADETFDYLISSHVIEHVPNLFAAYAEASRVVKNEGVFFCIFPKRNADPNDRVRALTTLESMIDAFEKRIDMSVMPEYNWRGHYHVFSMQSMLRAINMINSVGLGHWLIECLEETDSKVGNGHTVVLRKQIGLSALNCQDASQFNDEFNARYQAQDFAGALQLVKVALSLDFFNAQNLYLAFALSCQLDNAREGIEFLRQALILTPENEEFRKLFVQVTGGPFINPVH
ncbi:class I SAM-dependent methyltransferase [Pseudomonas rubra]|uniref:Class I SAM-dependent methyltransferase n=1 Tax=Pseudomonas rubra TaxID=2942627 RepID=A0ABT5P6H2_9PSED|nr:class I SAM-dependent methyltransferase [Pseudomonas rubra]MDD1013891.1 class I SAM-dependent methyltransferase [Pseudomonas rubra]MDD1038288.1 class I SAM-dependent methyltransferase [Pseudomonas rubra]MDD1154622.1 class I SAM-dependent methyltransferase [Pseudomonas rubra]